MSGHRGSGAGLALPEESKAPPAPPAGAPDPAPVPPEYPMTAGALILAMFPVALFWCPMIATNPMIAIITIIAGINRLLFPIKNHFVIAPTHEFRLF